jgi:Ca2+-binding RTX toxin-like protein
MGNIVVRGRPLGNVPVAGPYHHVYILYTNDSGARTVFHAFTDGGGGSSGGLPSMFPASSGSGGGSWGTLTGYERPYEIINGQTPPDWDAGGNHPSTPPLIEGSDQALSPVLDRMRERLNQINDADVPYNPVLQNSNAFVNDLLEAGGITPALPTGVDGDPIWAPAYDKNLPSEPGSGNYYTDLLKDYLKHVYNNAIDVSAGAINDLIDSVSDFIDDPGWIDDIIDDFTDAIANQFIRNIDPIILDLDGDGIEFVSSTDITIFFDMDGDGRRERTGWITADDGFLALDANRNGKVDNIDELFGRDGQSGFAELLVLDTNGDRVLDSRDAQWSQLQIWRDLNQNGVGDAGELSSIASYRIASIDLNFTVVNAVASGNLIHEQSTYRLTDGTIRTVVDGWLSVNGALTAYELSDGVPPDIAALPDLRGSGNLLNLRVAAASDPQLKTTLQVFDALTPTSLGAWPRLVEEIIYLWANVEGVATNARGPNFDGRKLAAIEAFLGREFERGGLRNPVPQAVPDLQATWDGLFQKVSAALLVQGPLSPFVSSTLVVPSTGEVISALSLSDISDGIANLVRDLPLREAAQILSALRPVARELGAAEGLSNGQIAAELASAATALGIGAFQAALDAGSRDGVARVSGPSAMHLYTGAADDINVGGRQMIFAGGGNDFVASGDETQPKVLDGEAGNDSLFGGSGDDVLVGGPDIDLLIGGLGNDLYRVDHVADSVIELIGSGADTVEASVSFALPSNTEALILTGAGNLVGTGNELNNRLVGNAGNNRLVGLDGNDRLDGGAGADTMLGGRGDDVYVVDAAGDVVSEARATDGTDRVEASISYVLGRFVENLTLTGAANLSGTGNGLANRIEGNAGNNTLDGGAGPDTLVGRAGDDLYIVDAGDQVVEAAAAGNDTVRSSVSFALGNTIEVLELTGTADINGSGGSGANLLRGNAGSNLLDGLAGADTMVGGEGDDTYVVDNTGDVVTEVANGGYDRVQSSIAYVLGAEVEALLLTGNGAIAGTGNALDNEITGHGGANTLVGAAGHDTIDGDAGNDSLDGGEGNDTLIGGAGNDTMAGGAGNDVYDVNALGDAVSERADAGTDLVRSAVTLTLGDNVENLELTGGAAIEGRGNALANRIVGNNAANLLDGGAGRDTMIGGGGNDIYVVDVAQDVVDESTGSGQDTVRSAVSWTLGFGFEGLELTGAGNLVGTGNELNNRLVGNAGNNRLVGLDGNDRLDGGAGADTMLGGRGDDVYVVDAAGDVVSEARATDGTDRVEASISYVLGRFVENLTLTGAANLSGTGNGLANRIEGNAGNNTLDGGAGPDTLVGRAGDDLYIVDAGDQVVEAAAAGNDTVRSSVSFALGNTIEVLELTGTADINGSGGSGANLLRGNAGSNLLDGLAGADTMVGGEGDDTYVVDNTGDVVTEVANGGYDRVQSSIAYVLGAEVEALLLTGNGAIAGTGNALDNEITGHGGANTLVGAAGHDTIDGDAGNDSLDGGEGNDTLIGGAGNDTMAGGAGNDVYVLSETTDVIIEAVSGGIDTVLVSFGWVLPVGIENATYVGVGPGDLIGNGANNYLLGNAAANVLVGGGGNDTLIGQGGNDVYEVDTVGDLVVEQAGGGRDLIRALISYRLNPNLEDLTLVGPDDLQGRGNDAANRITGNAGSNVLIGGGGGDTMEGGAGADRFIYEALSDSGTSSGLADLILDFRPSEGDKLDFSALDANALIDGDQAFILIGSGAFTGAGQIRITEAAGQRTIALNVDGNLAADLIVVLSGTGILGGNDFVL